MPSRRLVSPLHLLDFQHRCQLVRHEGAVKRRLATEWKSRPCTAGRVSRAGSVDSAQGGQIAGRVSRDLYPMASGRRQRCRDLGAEHGVPVALSLVVFCVQVS